MAKQQTENAGFLQRAQNYIKGVQSELRKVTWPSKKELINYTLIVIVLTLILALIIGLSDVLLNQIFFDWL